ncbi:MAG: response regulator [Deltaproteobacteria bacterium]|nr:response regulator [Deltaproteobacteria bacterium]
MNSLKILVVDDDPATRLLLKKWLEKEDFDVEIAVNGTEAVGLISGHYYDVVLTDLMMPGGLDGIGVLEKTKETHDGRTEVILITAFASVENAVAAMRKGAADYLQKPINHDELMLRLEKISSMKALIKNASDLREAMDVTEQNAAATIQNLEMEISRLNKKLSEV